jgi:hypothetical protein
MHDIINNVLREENATVQIYCFVKLDLEWCNSRTSTRANVENTLHQRYVLNVLFNDTIVKEESTKVSIHLPVLSFD